MTVDVFKALDPWTNLDRALAGRVGTIPGTDLSPLTPELSPADLPEGFDGEPSHTMRADPKRWVRWFVPPHPLALTPQMCDAAIAHTSVRSAPAGMRKRPASSMRVSAQTEPVVWRMYAAIAAVNAHTMGAEWVRARYVNVCRYQSGQGLEWHVDNAVEHNGEVWTGFVLTALAQLSNADEYTGGDLQFDLTRGRRILTAPRERGTVVVFPAMVSHGVRPLKTGTRFSLDARGLRPDARPVTIVSRPNTHRAARRSTKRRLP